MSENESPTTQQPGRFAQIAAIVFAAAYFVFVAYVALNRTDQSVSSEQWTRIIHLIGGPEAIVFAGAGFLFGREVNRQRAESAEKQVASVTGQAQSAAAKASEAQAKATESEKKASEADAKGKALSAAVLGKLEASNPTPLDSDSLRSTSTSHLQELASIAKRLYS